MESHAYFTETFKVMECDCDWSRKLTPGAFMRLAQEISGDHCNSIGLTDAFYKQHHAAFLMAKLAMRWQRVPLAGETLTLRTMPENATRAIYKRVTAAYDGAGECIGLLDSRWVLVDTDTRRILRRPPEAFANLPFDAEVPFQLPIEILRPATTEPVGEETATYTRCDLNGHMNNTRYGDVAADAVPMELLQSRAIKALTISYHNEVPMGESFSLERGLLENGGWFVAGHRQGKCCFEANLELE